jgi:hypothetical protein
MTKETKKKEDHEREMETQKELNQKMEEEREKREL